MPAERKGRGRPKQDRCYMDHPRTPENVDKNGNCKKCKRANRVMKNRSRAMKNQRPLQTRD